MLNNNYGICRDQLHSLLLARQSWQVHQTPLQSLNKAQPCSHRLSLENLATCNTSPNCINFRADLSRITQLFHQPVTHPWLALHPHSMLASFLLALFPTPNSNGLFYAIDWRDMNLTTIMCGAFTMSQTTAASKTLRF